MDHKTSLAARTMWNAAGSLAASLGRIVSAVVIARQLGPENAGKYAFLAVLAEFVTLLVSCGLPNTMTRFLAERAGRGDAVGQAAVVAWTARRYVWPVLLGMVAVFFGLSGYGATTNLLVSVFLFSLCAYTLIHAYLAGVQNFRALARINLISGVTLLIVQPVGVALFGLNGALAGGIISSLACLVALGPILAAARSPGQPGADVDRREIGRYALYTWLSALVSAVAWTRTEIFFINQLGTDAQAGFFNVGLTLYTGVATAVTLLTGALTPHFSALVGKGDREGLQRDYRRLAAYVALFAFPVSLGGAAVMPELLTLIYGEAYAPAVPSATLLMASGAFAFAGVGSSITYAFGKSHFVLMVAIVCALIMVSGCVALIPALGAEGAAIARVGAQLVSVVIGTLVVHFALKVVPPYGVLFRIGAAALLCAGAARGAMLLAPDAGLVAHVACGAIVYPIALRLLGGLPGNEADALVRAVSKLPGFAARCAVPLTRWVLVRPR